MLPLWSSWSSRESHDVAILNGPGLNGAVVLGRSNTPNEPQSVSALNAFTMGDNVVPLTHELSGDRARGVRGEGEVLDLPPATSENEEESSGGETRTLNLAAAPDEDFEQHQLE